MKSDVQTSIYKNLIQLGSDIGRTRIIQIIFTQFLSIFSSLIDAISVGAVIPFLAILSAPENILTSPKIKLFISFLNITSKEQLIIVTTISFIILVILSGILRWALIYLNSRVSNSIGSHLSYLLYRNTLYQSYLNHTSRNSSEIITGINKGSEVVGQIINPIFLLINSLFTIIFLLITLILLNPKIIILTFLIITSLYLIIMFFVKDILIKESKFMNIKKPLMYKAMHEGLGGIRDILIDGTQEIYSKIFYKSEYEFRRSNSKVVLLTNTPNIVIQALGIALIAFFASSIAIKNEVNNNDFATGLPFLGSLAFAYLKMSPAIQQVYSTWANLKNGELNLKYVIDFLKIPLPPYAGKPLPQPINFVDNITINNLSFCYNSNSEIVLNNINLKIKKGSMVGFVGKTGSGKSTLLDILMALIEPTHGNLRIDEEVINKNNFRSWQVHIAHVPQAIYLSDATIAENIAFGVPLEKIDFNRVKMAAEKAQLIDTIEKLESNYYTKVGERGVRLSGGQRQRLGIARALYKKADVIVFDEATSALDNNTESEVMNAIENLDNNLTILIVAHRLSTLKNCNQIIEIKDNKLIIYDNFELFNKSIRT